MMATTIVTVRFSTHCRPKNLKQYHSDLAMPWWIGMQTLYLRSEAPSSQQSTYRSGQGLASLSGVEHNVDVLDSPDPNAMYRA
jgi:hypothetical protein